MREDRLLVERICRGDPTALGWIYEKYKRDLLTVAACLLSDRHLAEDCLHDVLVDFAAGIDGIRLRGSLRSYLAACVANRARDKLRERSRRAAHASDGRILDKFAGHSRDPVKELIDREEGKRLLEALLELPYDQREVVTLHLHGGLKFRQIAERRGASINTVQSRYRHALEKLRAILERGVRR